MASISAVELSFFTRRTSRKTLPGLDLPASPAVAARLRDESDVEGVREALAALEGELAALRVRLHEKETELKRTLAELKARDDEVRAVKAAVGWRMGEMGSEEDMAVVWAVEGEGVGGEVKMAEDEGGGIEEMAEAVYRGADGREGDAKEGEKAEEADEVVADVDGVTEDVDDGATEAGKGGMETAEAEASKQRKDVPKAGKTHKTVMVPQETNRGVDGGDKKAEEGVEEAEEAVEQSKGAIDRTEEAEEQAEEEIEQAAEAVEQAEDSGEEVGFADQEADEVVKDTEKVNEDAEERDKDAAEASKYGNTEAKRTDERNEAPEMRETDNDLRAAQKADPEIPCADAVFEESDGGAKEEGKVAVEAVERDENFKVGEEANCGVDDPIELAEEAKEPKKEAVEAEMEAEAAREGEEEAEARGESEEADEVVENADKGATEAGIVAKGMAEESKREGEGVELVDGNSETPARKETSESVKVTHEANGGVDDADQEAELAEETKEATEEAEREMEKAEEGVGEEKAEEAEEDVKEAGEIFYDADEVVEDAEEGANEAGMVAKGMAEESKQEGEGIELVDESDETPELRETDVSLKVSQEADRGMYGADEKVEMAGEVFYDADEVVEDAEEGDKEADMVAKGSAQVSKQADEVDDRRGQASTQRETDQNWKALRDMTMATVDTIVDAQVIAGMAEEEESRERIRKDLEGILETLSPSWAGKEASEARAESKRLRSYEEAIGTANRYTELRAGSEEILTLDSEIREHVVCASEADEAVISAEDDFKKVTKISKSLEIKLGENGERAKDWEASTQTAKGDLRLAEAVFASIEELAEAADVLVGKTEEEERKECIGWRGLEEELTDVKEAVERAEKEADETRMKREALMSKYTLPNNGTAARYLMTRAPNVVTSDKLRDDKVCAASMDGVLKDRSGGANEDLWEMREVLKSSAASPPENGSSLKWANKSSWAVYPKAGMVNGDLSSTKEAVSPFIKNEKAAEIEAGKAEDKESGWRLTGKGPEEQLEVVKRGTERAEKEDVETRTVIESLICSEEPEMNGIATKKRIWATNVVLKVGSEGMAGPGMELRNVAVREMAAKEAAHAADEENCEGIGKVLDTYERGVGREDMKIEEKQKDKGQGGKIVRVAVLMLVHGIIGGAIRMIGKEDHSTDESADDSSGWPCWGSFYP